MAKSKVDSKTSSKSASKVPAAAKSNVKPLDKSNSGMATQAQSLPMDIFKASPQDGKLAAVSGNATPYVQFFHSNANNSSELLASFRNLVNGDPVLVRGPNLDKLEPLQYIMTDTHYQYFAEVDSLSTIIRSKIPESVDERCPQGMTEFIEALVFVLVNSEDICCARMRMRGPKCKGFKQSHAELSAMRFSIEEGEWLKEHKDNLLASKSGLADWAWLKHEATITSTQGKTNEYEVMTTTSETTSVSILHTLSKLFKDADFVKGCKAAQAELMDRWTTEIVKKQIR